MNGSDIDYCAILPHWAFHVLKTVFAHTNEESAENLTKLK
jgi:hypothetical protein